jgi:mercuric ion transport protein
MTGQVRAAFLAALASLGVSACCVLPMVFLLFGLGGSWLAVFGKIAAASFYVLGLSSFLILVAWVLAIRRGSSRNLRRWLVASTVLLGLAWLVVFNESRINDFLMTLM